MKINVIKKLAENESVENLQKAEEEIYNEQEPTSVQVEGEDLGEKLTHIIGAMWVIDEVKTNDTDIKQAVRAYAQKVRKSIT